MAFKVLEQGTWGIKATDSTEGSENAVSAELKKEKKEMCNRDVE